MLVSIGFVSKLFGVSPQTIRNWTKDGHFKEHRTLGGHRRYSLEEVERAKSGNAQEETVTTMDDSQVKTDPG